MITSKLDRYSIVNKELKDFKSYLIDQNRMGWNLRFNDFEKILRDIESKYDCRIIHMYNRHTGHKFLTKFFDK